MGSTRDWAADKEDEIKYCRHGNPSLYFDACMYKGCKAARAYADEREKLMKDCLHSFEQFLKTQPDTLWKTLTDKAIGKN